MIVFPLGFLADLTPPGPDADATAWIAAVEAADGEALEPAVRSAMNDLVVDLKATDAWSGDANLTVTYGARTLAGALVPIKGTAFTPSGFDGADRSRTTGLVGNGTDKYLSGVNSNAFPQNDYGVFVYQDDAPDTTASTRAYFGDNAAGDPGVTMLGAITPDSIFSRSRSAAITNPVPGSSFAGAGLVGISRSSGGSYRVDWPAGSATSTVVSDGIKNGTMYFFQRGSSNPSNARLGAFYQGRSYTRSAVEAAISAYKAAITAALE